MFDYFGITHQSGGHIALFISTVAISSLMYIILTFIIQLLSYTNDWLHDVGVTYKYTMTEIVRKFVSKKTDTYVDGDDIWGRGWLYFVSLSLSVVYYYVAAVLLIVYLIMYTLRATIRVKSLLTNHIKNKKAHQ